MSIKLKQALRFVFFLGLGIGLLYLAFVNLNLDYNKVKAGFKSANYFWIGAALIISLTSHWFRALRWNQMLEPLAKKPTSLQSFNAVMIGYLFNFAIPRMGEVSRCGILYRTNRIPVNQSLGTVVVERVFDMVILLLLTIVVLLLQFDTLYGFFNDTFIAPISQKLGGSNGLMFIWLMLASLLIAFVLYKFKNKLAESALVFKFSGLLQGFASGFKSVFSLKQPLLFFVYTFIIWILYFLNTWCYLMAFDGTASVRLAAALSILVVGTFGFAAPVSGGIGAYHIFVVKGLALYGVSSLDGGVFGFVSHGVQMLMILMIGGISLILTIIEERKKDAA